MSTFLQDLPDDDRYYCSFCKQNRECITCWHVRSMREYTESEIIARGWTFERSEFGLYHIYDTHGHLLGADQDIDAAYNRSLAMMMVRKS